MEIEELCKKLRPVLGKKADALWHAYLLEDSEGKRELASNIEILYAKLLNRTLTDDRILLIPPAEKVVHGKYPIGNIVYNEKELYTFAIRDDELLQHCTILGRTGSGKTNTAFLLLLGLLHDKKPFLILDWKRNYRELFGMLPEERKKDILVFTVGRSVSPLKFNPLIPPKETPPEMWLKKLIEIIAHAFYCGDGVMYLLQQALDEVYRRFGVYEGRPEKWPTMQDVLTYLQAYKVKGREIGWMSSTLRAVNTLCFGEMGKVLNVRQQVGLGELLEKNVILELDSLTSADKIFFIETLLLWIYHYRMAQGTRETLKHVLLVEEAHHIVLKQKMDLKGGETIMDVILREIRELGEGIILIDQTPSQISNVALGNSYTTITMNLKHASDVNSAAQCMLLGLTEKEYLGILPVGYAICKLQGRIFRPFLVKVPLIKIEKGKVTDEDVKERMGDYFGFEHRAKEEQNTSFSGFSPASNTSQEKPEVFRVFRPSDKLNENEKKLLLDILKKPPTPTFTRYGRLGFNSYLGNEAKSSLANKGLITVESIPTSNARVKLMELTNKGKNFLSNLGHKIKTEPDGPEHKFWKSKVAEYYKKKGHTVEIEKNGTDVLVDNKLPVEIVTGKSDEIKNIVRNLTNYNQSLSVVINKQARRKLIEDLRKANLLDDERIKIVDTRGYT